MILFILLKEQKECVMYMFYRNFTTLEKSP